MHCAVQKLMKELVSYYLKAGTVNVIPCLIMRMDLQKGSYNSMHLILQL